jgi:hypothetical protein
VFRYTATAAFVWGTLSAAALAEGAAPAFPPSSAPFPIGIASSAPVLEPGASVLVSWPAGAVGTRFDEMELLLSVDGGRTFPVRVTRRIAPSEIGFSWTVPSLPAARARLALRVGVDEEEEAETIVGLSDEFAIAPSAHGEELFRVGGEERTRDALEDSPAPRPESSLDGAPSLFAGTDPPEATGTGRSPDSESARVRAKRDPSSALAAAASSRANPSRSVAPVRLPMRL